MSDDYAALFQDAPAVTVKTVDCVKVSTLKQDLEDEQGKFVEDELAIEVDSTTCRTADEQLLLSLLLEAADPTMPRYVLIEIAEAGSASFTQAFRGVLRTDIQATDIRWYGAEYGTDPTPERLYKFAAKSYSVAVMDKELETLLPASLTDYAHPFWAEFSTFLSTKVKHWLAASGYYNTLVDNEAYRYAATYFHALTDINDALRFMADRIVDLTGGPSFDIFINESPLLMTLGTPELVYGNSAAGSVLYGDLAPAVQHRTTHVVNDAKLGDGELGPLVSLHLLVPETDTNKPFSWLRSKTFSQLCYDLARAFGMFAVFEYDTNGDLNISFKSRDNIYKDGTGATKRVYVRDVDSGSIKTQPTTVNAEKERWQGFINQFALEGKDVFKRDRNQGYQRSELAKANPPKERLLPVTIGATLMDTYETYYNSTYRKLWNTGWYYRLLSEVGATDPPATVDNYYTTTYINPDSPSLTTALYVRTSNEVYRHFVIGSGFVDTGRRYNSVRPVTQIDVTVDGVTETFTELAEYVNRLKGLDGLYYESEYELSVPYLSAFRRTPTGSDSYFNLELGSTVTVDGVDYVVVGVERDFDALTTKMRLHALTRFNIFAKPSTVQVADIDASAQDPNVPEERRANVETFVAGENITAGWAVAIDDTGKAIKAKPIAAQYNTVVGVALETRTVGQTVSVCTSGVCVVPDSYTVGQPLWLRDGTPNMDELRINTPSASEHVDQKIGTCVGAGAIEVNIGRPFVWFGF